MSGRIEKCYIFLKGQYVVFQFWSRQTLDASPLRHPLPRPLTPPFHSPSEVENTRFSVFEKKRYGRTD